MCLFTAGPQADEGPVGLHPEPNGPLQANSPPNPEALSGDLDLDNN